MPAIPMGSEFLFYDLQQRPVSRAMVLIHGAGGDRSHWPAGLAELPGCNVFFLDLPGHGRSTGQGRSSIDAYADVVSRFVAAQGLSDVVLCGHSMGGAIVLALALRRPNWLSGIVLVGSGARLKVMPDLLTQLESDFPAAIDLICQALFGPDAPAAMQRAERERYLATDWRLIRVDLLACNDFDVSARLAEIAVPALVVTGEADVLTPVKYARFLQENIPGAQLRLIPGAGHLVARENPTAFLQALADFLG